MGRGTPAWPTPNHPTLEWPKPRLWAGLGAYRDCDDHCTFAVSNAAHWPGLNPSIRDHPRPSPEHPMDHPRMRPPIPQMYDRVALCTQIFPNPLLHMTLAGQERSGPKVQHDQTFAVSNAAYWPGLNPSIRDHPPYGSSPNAPSDTAKV